VTADYWQQQEQLERRHYEEHYRHATGSRNAIANSLGDYMHIGTFSQSKYLKQSDTDENGFLATITKVEAENVAKQGEEKKIRCIVYFREQEKGMVFNKTNLNRAAKICGSEDTDNWIGKKVVVFLDPDVEMGGEIVGGLRVRAPKKPAAEPKQPVGSIADMENDVPF